MDVHMIKSETDYDEAMERFMELMEEEITPGSDLENEFELLALVIENYEQKVIDPIQVDPIEAIRFRMDQQNLTQKDLVPFIGSASKVSEVLSGKCNLSLSMIRKLNKGLGIPAESLIQEPLHREMIQTEPLYDYARFPLKEMLARSCFPEKGVSLSQVKENAEEWVGQFFSRYGLKQVPPAFLRSPMTQASQREIDAYALLAWKACVIRKAQSQQLNADFNVDKLTEDWFCNLARLSRYAGPQAVSDYLADYGIYFVIEPHFNKTYLDGAALWWQDKPIVALTLRHDRLDHFWFALFHELAHVKLHLGSEHDFFADDLSAVQENHFETEADALALESLIPEMVWECSDLKRTRQKKYVEPLARQLQIHPAIVAGRYRYETKNWRIFTQFIGRNEVRKLFEIESHVEVR